MPEKTKWSPSGFPIAQCAAALGQFLERRLPAIQKSIGANARILGVACIDSGKLGIVLVCDKAPTETLADFAYEYGNDGARSVSVRWAAGTVNLTAGEAAGCSNLANPANGLAVTTASTVSATVAAPAPASAILCGTNAQGQGVIKEGTAGLNIIFSGTTVCLGNAHVMVLRKDQAGAPTPPTAKVKLGSDPNAATLFGYKPITFVAANPSFLNTWDLAMAQYVNPARAAATMMACTNINVRFNYPAGFAVSGSVATGQEAHYTGAASCGRGMSLLSGLFQPTVLVPENNVNKPAKFACQLVFTHSTQDRDSGAVIVRTSDNKVLGLHVGNTTFLGQSCNFANALYRAPWTAVASPNGLLAFVPDQGRPYPDLFDDTLHPW